jgi:hypothetical protein
MLRRKRKSPQEMEIEVEKKGRPKKSKKIDPQTSLQL